MGGRPVAGGITACASYFSVLELALQYASYSFSSQKTASGQNPYCPQPGSQRRFKKDDRGFPSETHGKGVSEGSVQAVEGGQIEYYSFQQISPFSLEAK